MPDIVDVFGEAPFRPLELTNAFELIVPRPTLLGRLGTNLFADIPSHTGTVAAYQISRNQRLVSTSPLGAPPEQLEQTGGKMRRFGTHRIAKATTLQAVSLQNILQQPLFQAVQSVQAELARRIALIIDDIELTLEYHRLGAVLGLQMDADGQTVLHDWYDEWGVTRPDPIYFDLSNPDAEPRLTCRKLRNQVIDAGKGAFVEGQTVVHALCGEGFFTKLITHPRVKEAYLNYQAAAELLNRIPDSFNFGGIVFHDYRSALDPRFGIAEDEARFFPVGAGQVFQHVHGPAEFSPYINQPGRKLVTIQFSDQKRQAWSTVELYSYPLLMNLRPEMCGSAKAGADPG